MKQTETNKTMALAGIFQAAHLANQLAFSNHINEATYVTSLESIFKIDTPDVMSIYGNLNNIRVGLSYIKQYATKNPPFKETILIRYILYITELAKKVVKNKELFSHLQKRLQPIISQAHHLGPTHEIVIKELATLYRQVFLNRKLQIPILGKLNTLKQKDSLDKIFAILIAGIRSAVLWYQVGGNRWQFFLFRSRLKASANLLLQHEYSRQ